MATFGISSLRRILRNYAAHRLRLPEIPVALHRLARQGFNPGLVFDVGAYRGDFARVCKKIWPATQVACFEPQHSILPALRRYASTTPQVHVFEFLLGPEESNQVVLNEADTASSILLEKDGPKHPIAMYKMRTVDSVIESETQRAPDFLKLDVQGYELEVLKGATSYLNEIQVILAELNFLDLHEGISLIDEVVRWLAERGWVAFDICGLTRRPLDDALWQSDFIFVPSNSALRRDKRWTSS
jgi:FkbM family methyltransferase